MRWFEVTLRVRCNTDNMATADQARAVIQDALMIHAADARRRNLGWTLDIGSVEDVTFDPAPARPAQRSAE